MFPRTTGRSLGALAALVAVAALIVPATAPAQTTVTKKVTVPGLVVVHNANRPGDPGNCSAITFVEWADVPGTLRATAYYMWKGTEKRSKAADAPFHDVFEHVATYRVAPGKHWIQIGASWSDGPRANDCSESAAKTRAFYPNPNTTVDLFVDNTAKCTAAKAAVLKAQTGLKKAQARLKKAKTPKAKKRERTSVKKNQARVTKALAKQTTECTSS